MTTTRHRPMGAQHACRLPRAHDYRPGDRWSCYICSSSWSLVRYSADLSRRRPGVHRLGPDAALWRRRLVASTLARLTDQVLGR